MQLSGQDEQDLQQLVLAGNDYEVTHLVYELMNLSPFQKHERVRVLLHLGERFLILGLLQEDGPYETHTVEALVRRRVQERCFFPPQVRDGRALEWFKEAINNFTAIDREILDSTPSERFQTFQRQGIVYALLGKHDISIRHLCVARSSTSDPLQHAHLSYLEGLVLCLKGDNKEAIRAFSDALPRL